MKKKRQKIVRPNSPNKLQMQRKNEEAIRNRFSIQPNDPLLKSRKRKLNSKKRPKHVTVVDAPIKNTILITGGIGDVITLESHFSDVQRNKLTTILYASRKQPIIENMFNGVSNYPNLRKHASVWDNWESQWCFITKAQLMEKIESHNKRSGHDLTTCEDWSIYLKFPQIKAGHLRYTGSSLLKEDFDVSEFNLPNEYAIICPYSSDKRLKKRDFTKDDWDLTFKWLKDRQLQGIILNSGAEKTTTHESLINLSNKTTLHQSAQIIKDSAQYIGVDSCMSVLAAQSLPHTSLAVKSVNQQCYKEKAIYYAPQTNYNFMGESIGEVFEANVE